MSRSYELTVRGGTVVNADRMWRADVGITGGRIVAVEETLPAGEEDLTADGLLVMPGGIDSHVHLDQPFSSGAAIADDFASGTASALAGGTTTILSFVMQPRGGSLAVAAAAYRRLAARSRVDYSFHLTVTDPSLRVLAEELPALVAEGCRSIKIFMANASTRLTDAQILDVLAAARRLGALVCVHAEHHELMEWLTGRLLEQGITAPAALALAKPILAEREAVHRILSFAEALDTPVHIFHVSGGSPAEELARARQRGVKAWGETCTQYLVFTSDDLRRPGFEGAKFMFAPAPRTRKDRQALWAAIADGTISVISSDHSPLRYDDPQGKMLAGIGAPFSKVPNGIPGLAARLPLVFSEGVHQGRIDACAFVGLVSTNPAKLFGLYPTKGVVAVGSDADLLLWDPAREHTLSQAGMHHGSDYTPYEGRRVTGAPISVVLRGLLAFAGGEVLAQPGWGKFLPRGPYPEIAPAGRFAAGFNPHT